MANIIENNNIKNMQTHIDKAYQFLEDNLPTTYSIAVQKNLQYQKITVSTSVIKNVRNRVSVRIDVLNALLELARKNKAQVEELITKIN